MNNLSETEKLHRLFHDFVVMELKAGRDVPPEISAVLLGDSFGHVHPGGASSLDDDSLHEVLDRFENYLKTKSVNCKSSVCASKSMQGDDTKWDENISKWTHLFERKLSAVENVVQELKALCNLCRSFGDVVQNLCKTSNLNHDLTKLQRQYVYHKVCRRYFFETPKTYEALIKLRQILEKERNSLRCRAHSLEEQKEEYSHYLDDELIDFLSMCETFRQLNLRKESLL